MWQLYIAIDGGLILSSIHKGFDPENPFKRIEGKGFFTNLISWNSASYIEYNMSLFSKICNVENNMPPPLFKAEIRESYNVKGRYKIKDLQFMPSSLENEEDDYNGFELRWRFEKIEKM